MKAGKKVMHFNFSDEEWMTINENGEIVFEDNVRCSQEEFWSHRTEESWNGGYIFYPEPEMLEPAAPSQPAGEVWSEVNEIIQHGLSALHETNPEKQQDEEVVLAWIVNESRKLAIGSLKKIRENAAAILATISSPKSMTNEQMKEVEEIATEILDFCCENATLNRLESETVALREELERAKQFKDYVHKRLDDMGIEKDPESEHKVAGCRIGGRLDIVENDRLREEVSAQVSKKIERVLQPKSLTDTFTWDQFDEAISTAFRAREEGK
jgi:hypothetical protein